MTRNVDRLTSRPSTALRPMATPAAAVIGYLRSRHTAASLGRGDNLQCSSPNDQKNLHPTRSPMKFSMCAPEEGVGVTGALLQTQGLRHAHQRGQHGRGRGAVLLQQLHAAGAQLLLLGARPDLRRRPFSHCGCRLAGRQSSRRRARPFVKVDTSLGKSLCYTRLVPVLNLLVDSAIAWRRPVARAAEEPSAHVLQITWYMAVARTAAAPTGRPLPLAPMLRSVSVDRPTPVHTRAMAAMTWADAVLLKSNHSMSSTAGATAILVICGGCAWQRQRLPSWLVGCDCACIICVTMLYL